MKTQLFCVYDSKAAFYGRPFHAINHDVALRTARDLANDPRGEVNKHPEDYSLFHIGEFDDQTGKVSMNEPILHIVNFHELVNSNE